MGFILMFEPVQNQEKTDEINQKQRHTDKNLSDMQFYFVRYNPRLAAYT